MKIPVTTTELKGLHKAYFTVNLDSRIAVMRKIVGWYETYIPFVKGKWNTTQTAAFEKGLKIRSRAMDGRTPLEEADTALRMMIRFFENAVNEAGLPILANTIAEFDTKKASLEAAAAKKIARYKNLLDSLTQIFDPFGITFLIDDRAATIAAATGKRIMINPAIAEELFALNSLELQARLSPVVLSTLSVTVNAAGAMVQDFQAYISATKRMLETLFAQMASNAPIVSAPAAPVGGSAPEPKAPRQAPKASTIPNQYRGAKGTVFERLVSNPGSWCLVDDIFAGLGVAPSTTYRLLAHLAADGASSKKFSINIDRKSGKVVYSAV